MKDYYQILSVSENANENEIKKSFRRLAKQYHPDANPNNKQAEARFKEISEAHEVLSDKTKRTQYDQMRKYGSGVFSGGGYQGGGKGMNVDDISSIFGEFGGFGSFADIFSSIFGDMGGNAGYGNTSQRAASNDVYSEIEIPFDIAVKGGKVNLNLEIPAVCEICHGSGVRSGSNSVICPDCGGRGSVSYSHGNFSVSRTCPRCLGRGKIRGEACQNCRGAGSIKSRKTIAVNIPAGMDSGKQIRLKGLGGAGKNGKSGDLYLQVKVVPHHFFWRAGNDIHCRIPISPELAASGTKIRVSTISGKKIDLNIPAGTKAGAKLRMKGFGLSIGGKQGDQIVEIDLSGSGNGNDKAKKSREKGAGAR